MSKKTSYQSQPKPEAVEVLEREAVVEAIEEVAVEPEVKEQPKPAPQAKAQEIGLEQVAIKYAKAFKSHHLQSLIAFAKSRGFKVSGSELEMKSVLVAFGYKI